MIKQLQNITKKQKEIIYLLLKFRFLNRAQIQQFLKHNDRRATNDLLNDLTAKEIIGRIYTNTFPEKIKPATYYLAKGAIKFLKAEGIEDKLLRKLYHETERSQSFLNRSLLLADIYLDLSNRKEAQFNMTLASDCSSHKYRELLEALLPHSLIEQKSADTSGYYFLEILSDVPYERLRQRLKKYLSFYESNEWEGVIGEDFPTVLIICKDNAMLVYVKRFLKRKLAEMEDESFVAHLTTLDKFKQSGLTGDIWEKA